MNTNDNMQPVSSASSASINDIVLIAKYALEYIDVLPKDLVLPATPGFDRDWADSVMDKFAKGQAMVPPVVQAPTDDDEVIQLEAAALLATLTEWSYEDMREDFADTNYDDADIRYICKAGPLTILRLINRVRAAPIVATVPSGWKMVPTVPTQEMRKAGQMAQIDLDRQISAGDALPYTAAWMAVWPAMVSAAPVRCVAAPSPTEQASDVHNAADCYSADEGDTWHDCPDDIVSVNGLKVGDEYEVLASVRAWTERYRVTKAPDDTSDDYEVERVAIPAVKGNAPVEVKS